MNDFLRLNKIGLTVWENFKRRPKFNKKEKLVCLMHGNERVRMVSAIFKHNMYSGVFEDLNPIDTPVNLFETDIDKINQYKLMKLSDVYQSDLEKGSCLYIPSYYWY